MKAKFMNIIIEDNDRIRRIETLIALLRVGEINSFQCLNSRVCRAKQSFSFQRIAHTRVDTMRFTPDLRNHDRRSLLLREPEIFVGELVGLFAYATGNNRTHFVEPFNGEQSVRSLNRAVSPERTSRPCRSWTNRTSSNICRPPI